MDALIFSSNPKLIYVAKNQLLKVFDGLLYAEAKKFKNNSFYQPFAWFPFKRKSSKYGLV